MTDIYYLNSKRIQDIMSKSRLYTYNCLDRCKSKRLCMVYLKQVYKCTSDIKLSNIDYYNLYNICYLLCEKNSGLDTSIYRCRQAKIFVYSIKKYPENIVTLIDKFCN